MPGFGGGGPPPPPPPPGGAIPARPPPAVAKDRGALLTDITKGAKLKKAVTNDRSAPLVGKVAGESSGPKIGGAPPIPGIKKSPAGLAPPVPRAGAANRARSNSDNAGGGAGGDTGGLPAAPQLGGLFAGGMPKLKKRGGIDTGRDGDSPYVSDPETSRSSAPKPPASFAPKPPPAARINTLRPTPQTTESSPPQVTNLLVANLRKPPLRPIPKPSSEILHRAPRSDSSPPRAPPVPPTISKPPPPPVSSRKPSTAAPPPPPPPPSVAPTPPAPPPPPPMSAPRPPAMRSIPPTLPSIPNGPSTPSLAMQAARNAFGSGPPSPGAPPPPPTPPPAAPSFSAPPAPSAPPSAPPVSRPSPQPIRSMLDPSSYTLSNGASPNHNSSPALGNSPLGGKGSIRIEDPRFKFQDESQLPKPRDFMGGAKRYRAGRGSSVPLDISQFG
ncbi:MAG: WH2 motif family [Lasallia pustulata]|uniref:WH2 motif family n=1 Tax=Lasallia pustulata TaxID=136370 RepID=A0A5M8PPL5_9LECA|nr:MAG: WH2 motif family [Lasallia pustulata]